MAVSPAQEDAITQRAVLGLVLDEYPAQFALFELVRELSRCGEEAGESVERAVAELVGAGLLHRCGEFVLASRAARRFHEIDNQGAE